MADSAFLGWFYNGRVRMAFDSRLHLPKPRRPCIRPESMVPHGITTSTESAAPAKPACIHPNRLRCFREVQSLAP